MPITISDVSFNASSHTVGVEALLGGAIGNQLISQSATQPTNIPGIVISQALGNGLGFGTLTFNPANMSLAWKAPTSTVFYTTIGISAGSVTVGGPDGSLIVDVNTASLPATYRSASIGISSPVGSVFPEVTPAMALGGDVQYRCVYFKNNHPTLSANDVRLYLHRPPTLPQTIALGVDPELPGDGVTSGVAQVIANAATQPVGVLWSSPVLAEQGINLGTLLPGQSRAIWQRRTVPPMSYGPLQMQTASLGVVLVG